MDKLKNNAGPLLYGVVVLVGISFIYWFGAVYH